MRCRKLSIKISCKKNDTSAKKETFFRILRKSILRLSRNTRDTGKHQTEKNQTVQVNYQITITGGKAMKMKKVLSFLLAGTIAISLAACGSAGSGSSTAETSTADSSTADTSTADTSDKTTEAVAGKSDAATKLVIWTQAKDLETFANKYVEANPDVQIQTVVIEPANYVTKVQTALNAGQTTPDIIVGEPQMLSTFYDADYFEDLDQAPYNAQQYDGQVVDYVWKAGQSSDGHQKAISYQITPAGIYYRRDIAQKVLGTDDPDQVGQYFKDYNTVLSTAQKMKDAGYRIFASDGEMSYFAGDSAWVKDNKLVVDQARKDYMDLCISLYQKDLTAYANQWSTPWYQAMSGPIPILSADVQNGTDSAVNVWADASTFSAATANNATTEVFAYGLPSWGVLTLRDNVGATSGKWGVCSGPSSGFGGGTFIGISKLSKQKEAAWDFLKFCTLNEDTANWWIKEPQGDTVSLKSVLDQHKDDTNDVYGGEKLYAFWLAQAEKIDYSKVTPYDTEIGQAWSDAIAAIKTGQSTKEEAVSNFYDVVQSTYPELTIDKG